MKRILDLRKARLIGSLVLVFGMAVMAPQISWAAVEWSPGFPKGVDDKALLQWNPESGASEYNIYKSEKEGEGLKLLATVKVNRYIDKGLPAGKTFYYYVAPVVGGKEAARSASGSVTTEKKKAFVPLKGAEIAGYRIKDNPDGSSVVTIRWEGAEGSELIGINVYKSKSKDKGFVMIGSSQGNSFEDPDVKAGDTYYYVVTAVDSQFNETPYSKEHKVSLPAREAKAVKETPPTKMKRAKLLFRITDFYEAEGDGKGKKVKQPIQRPRDVAVDNAVGHIYLSSIGYGGVLVYDMNGKFQFGIRKDGISGKEKFKVPQGITVGPGGDLYVSDFLSPDISVYDFKGKPLRTITVPLFNELSQRPARLYDMAVTNDGVIFVSDPEFNLVHAYTDKGKLLFDIKSYDKEEKGKFNGPSYMAFDAKGNLIFVNQGAANIMVYGTDGKFKRRISKSGFSAGELDIPVGITLSKNGEIYVASAITPNIQAFNSDGDFLYAICNEDCTGPIQSASIRGIYIDTQDRLYVAEDLLNRVSVYQLTDGLVEIVPDK